MVFDFLKMTAVTTRTWELDKEVEKVVSEYSRIGIIHTDFGVGNLGIVNNEYYFWDYGTSLFHGSNHIRLRNGKEYNHIEHIIEPARKLMRDADFYYDDLIHYGIDNHDRKRLNFIVANRSNCIVKLGEVIYKFNLEKREEESSVYMLCRDESLEKSECQMV